jgi:2,3-bisphosphoglycerate-independent phosphoglycerate mutase
MNPLESNQEKITADVLLVVLDGVGTVNRTVDQGNAIAGANLPTLNRLWKNEPTIQILAHGTAVGMPSDEDMGNSEVGHNVLGCGRIYDQGAKLVANSIRSGDLFKGETWKLCVQNVLDHSSTLHFLGLLSDGNVHSHIDHLYQMLDQAIQWGVTKVRIHILLDGRDVPEKSALEYVIPLEDKLEEYRKQGKDVRIASGGGRMTITMDRYEADWGMVEEGWKIHVLGEGRGFRSAREAIETFRTEDPKLIDQYLPAFVIVEESENGSRPVGRIQDQDSVIFTNFRGDRAIEISRAFTEENFSFFDRKRFPKVVFAGMMQYDGDLRIPPKYLVNPPAIERTMGEYLANQKVPQYAISETQKYGHVTYFWNGNKTGAFDPKYETYVEIRSDIIPFDQKPEMKAPEITEKLVEAIRTGEHRFYRVNYANGDMVGHTGNLPATIKALETLDECIEKLIQVCEEKGMVMLITADHGNADEMFQLDKKENPLLDKSGKPIPKTSHTLNPVNLCLYDPKHRFDLDSKKDPKPGLANIAASVLDILGFHAPDDYHPTLVTRKK